MNTLKSIHYNQNTAWNNGVDIFTDYQYTFLLHYCSISQSKGRRQIFRSISWDFSENRLPLPNGKSWIHYYVVIIFIAFIVVWKTFSFLGMKLTVNAIQVSCIIFSFYFQFFLLSFSPSLYFIKTTEGKHSLQSITFPRKSNRSKHTLDFDLFIYSALWSIPMFSGMWISQMLEPLLVTK